jgi:hypothetical protein
MKRWSGPSIDGQVINTLSGHPRIENGHKADENQVSKTSGSCSRVKFAPAARASARFVASSIVLPTTQFFPSVVCVREQGGKKW